VGSESDVHAFVQLCVRDGNLMLVCSFCQFAPALENTTWVISAIRVVGIEFTIV